MKVPFYNCVSQDALNVLQQKSKTGSFNISYLSSPESYLKLESAMHHAILDNVVKGYMSGTYTLPAQNIALKETWSTDNSVTTSMIVKDRLLPGLMLKGDYKQWVHSKKSNTEFSAKYANDIFAADARLSCSLSSMKSELSAVWRFDKWLLGCQVGIDLPTMNMTNTNIMIGYKSGNSSIQTYANNYTEFGGIIYHKINERMKLASSAVWNTEVPGNVFSVGMEYKMTPETVVQSKVTTDSEFSLSIMQQLSSGLKLGVYSKFKFSNFFDSQQQIGFGISYEQPSSCCKERDN
ncbi:Voltage-dependent anion-selective channel [Trichinella pseudospiralis]|uniref:Voltage-dependent anion-selective channel n=2 Tax=Trichinella pseudospiralis TaxID=6337 RepID=A0A0V1FBI6_TRIPS|nr:Voltage-dependent anion-selective channel [Trichinella pseudospiralis]KRY67457.1 Voltage-dependent anion-selective channel [Trichinella pseudospiralis]KRY83151.1 Voltage-dependent anion-selective channel [Trichinella pseudospiralis]KRZ23153.1 Voltage-dependent anion-selective channel [Trichinella pseudospiralis]KRZ29773.1 Voltage-dependent anion-selective channel [Trichinella pseudospiralis]